MSFRKGHGMTIPYGGEDVVSLRYQSDRPEPVKTFESGTQLLFTGALMVF